MTPFARPTEQDDPVAYEEALKEALGIGGFRLLPLPSAKALASRPSTQDLASLEIMMHAEGLRELQETLFHQHMPQASYDLETSRAAKGAIDIPTRAPDPGLLVPTACIDCPNCGGCANDHCGNERHTPKTSDDDEGDHCLCA